MYFNVSSFAVAWLAVDRLMLQKGLMCFRVTVFASSDLTSVVFVLARIFNVAFMFCFSICRSIGRSNVSTSSAIADVV